MCLNPNCQRHCFLHKGVIWPYHLSMKQRPWVLVVLAALHAFAPIGNIAFNAILMKRNILDYFVYAAQVEYLQRNWFVIVGPLVAGFAIYACKKWSFFVYLIAITMLFFFSYNGYMSKADSISIIPVIFVYLVNVVIVSYFLLPAVREIYFDPRLRWWESQPRYRCDYESSWSDGGQGAKGVVGNFSINGLFLKSDHFPEDGTQIQVTIKTDNGEKSFSGQTIHHGRQNAVGFGVQFAHTKDSTQAAKTIVSHLEEKGMRITQRDPGNEDSFIYWAKNLFTTGSGIIPKKDR